MTYAKKHALTDAKEIAGIKLALEIGVILTAIVLTIVSIF
jgi:hypothetical protein